MPSASPAGPSGSAVDESAVGLGQRMLATEELEMPLLEVRSVKLGEPPSA